MTINVDNIISTVAGIVQPSGDRLDFTAMVLSKNNALLAGITKTFYTALEVSDYFGVSTDETLVANKYFKGFDNSTRKPSKISYRLFSGSLEPARLFGGSLNGMTLAELKTLTGTIVVTSSAGNFTSAPIDFDPVISFSDAAQYINIAFLNSGNFTNPICTYNSVMNRFEFTSFDQGAAAFFELIIPLGDSLTAININEPDRAGYVNGSDPMTLTETLDDIILTERNWVSLITSFDPNNDEKMEVSEWANNQNSNYLYIARGIHPEAIDPLDVTDFATLVSDMEHEATAIIHGDMEHAAFMAGTIASIDTNRNNGWITLAYKSQTGLLPTISSTDNAVTLETKKYNFYGDWASRSQNKKMLMHGAMVGRWEWVDDFLGQIYLRSGFQEAGLSLLTQIRRLPYNRESYEILKSVWIGEVVSPALDIGIISAGVALDSTQKVLIDSLTGQDDSGEIVATTGWYLSVEDPTAAARVARETPIIIFVYTSGQAIHRLHIPVFLAQ